MDSIAVISDIHSNLPALKAVLADIDARGIGRIVCLGDVVGYGPQPIECVDLVRRRCERTLMGNHDFAVLFEPSNFNIGAEAACYWTRNVLANSDQPDERKARWEFLGSLPVKQGLDEGNSPIGATVLVHGSARRPVNEYIFPDDIYNNPHKLQGVFDRVKRLCLVGHTHVPGVFLTTPDFYSPDELGDVYKIDEHKAIINVGSVGQPRDRDVRASYVVLEEGAVRFVRVEYDVDETVRRIHAERELDDYLGSRLKEGR
jgi:predicted phosphodiesterase